MFALTAQRLDFWDKDFVIPPSPPGSFTPLRSPTLMKPVSWLQLLCIAFAVMCGPLAFAQSTGCGVFDAKVRFADGAEGCMKEFDFFNRPGMVAGQPTVSKGRQEPWVEGNIRGDFTFNQR